MKLSFLIILFMVITLSAHVQEVGYSITDNFLENPVGYKISEPTTFGSPLYYYFLEENVVVFMYELNCLDQGTWETNTRTITIRWEKGNIKNASGIHPINKYDYSSSV